MADLAKLREAILQRVGISERQLQRLIAAKETATLFPRDLAILAVAVDKGVSISKFASADDLSQLRGAASVSAPRPSAAPHAAASAANPTRRSPAAVTQPKKRSPGRKKVFVVHGRNERLRRDLFAFLRSLGLQPIEWRKGIEATNLPNPTIKQIIGVMFEQAAAVVVLLTPDDEVRLKPQHHKQSDPSYEKELVGQARPNVLLEAGMAFGTHPDATVLVQVGMVKPFTDVAGMHINHLNNSTESRLELITKLRGAKCAVDDGGSDWVTTGNFSIDDGQETR